MTTRFFIACLLFMAMPLLAQEATADQQAGQMRWMKHMTPGQAHKHMAEMAGKFNTVNRMWMAPGTEPMESPGTCENTMLMGGRYQRSTYAGNMMGMIFEGESVTGFDNTKNQFQSTWIDNLGSSVTMTTGTYDEASHTITMTGTMYEPMSGGDVTIKMVIRYESKDKYVMEMYMNGEFKVMEVVHTRA